MSEPRTHPRGTPPRPAERCWWAGEDPLYIDYHDREWGFPVADDRRLFEKICLEGFQAGLSWRTILGKREAFRAGFADFDFARIARFSDRDIERLLGDARIVRHRGKIESVRNNAQRAGDLVREFGSLAAYFWRFEPAGMSSAGPPQGAHCSPSGGSAAATAASGVGAQWTRPRHVTRDALAAMPTPGEAIALSKDLKRRGFTFVGPTTVYAFMQAMGLVNDHVDRCAIRAKAEKARARFERPRAKE